MLVRVKQEHVNSHYGQNRTVSLLNKHYEIFNTELKAIHNRIAGECALCQSKSPFPKELPGTPILSSRFSERILIDLKKLGEMGYMMVVICHFTSFVWLRFLADKRATGVASFLLETVIPDVKNINKQRIDATKEAAAALSDSLRPGKASEETSERESATDVPMTVEAMGDFRKIVLEVNTSVCFYSPCFDLYITPKFTMHSI